MLHLPGVDLTSDILTKPLGPTAYAPKLLGMAAFMTKTELNKLIRQCTNLASK
jgi:hypothetical protein